MGVQDLSLKRKTMAVIMLTSVAVDVDITQLVDGKVGVHAMCPKAILTGAR